MNSTSENNKKRKSIFTSKITLIIEGLITAIIISEIFLRIIGFSNPLFYEYDELLGWKLRPNASGWFQKEGGAYIEINSQGLRDREHNFKKPDTVLRIAVLGDSYAEAMTLPVEETFWSITEKKLNEIKPYNNKTVEVINFGVGGYGTDQEFLQLKRDVWNYSPDIIILTFFAGNDIRNNCRELDLSTGKPYFTLENNALILDTNFNKRSEIKKFISNMGKYPQRLFSQYSRLYQLYKLYKDYKHNMEISQQVSGDTIAGQEIGIGDAVYSKPTDPKWEKAWAITETLIVKMSEEIKAKNAYFIVLPATTSIQVHPDTNIRNQYIKKMNIKNLAYPEDRIKILGDTFGFKVIPLIKNFQVYAEQNKKYLHGYENLKLGFGHWNREGHSLAAEIIVNYILTNYKNIK